MNNNYIFVTTFNNDGYKLYGKKMLDAFLKYWPENQHIIVYIEDVELDKQLESNARIIIKDLLAISELVDFKSRHKNNPAANGYMPDNKSSKNFLFDAVRFSHKIFALYDAVTNNPTSNIIWLDADTITHSLVPADFLETTFPPANYGVAYLGRTRQYSECGWVIYYMNNPMMKDFWETFINYYKNDSIFSLKEWHDSYVFDVVRKEFEAKGMINHNITPGFAAGHPFINCVLGEYMDHMKGPRKTAGRSKKSERQTKLAKPISYWHE